MSPAGAAAADAAAAQAAAVQAALDAHVAGQLDEAERRYLALIASGVHRSSVYNNLGLLRESQGRTAGGAGERTADAALPLFTLAQRLNGADLNPLVNLVNRHIQARRYATAFEVLQDLARRDATGQTHAVVQQRLLEAYLASDDFSYRSAARDRVLLITANIHPGGTPYVALSNPTERLREHLLGLCAWLLDKSFTHVVIAENSDFEIDTAALQAFARPLHKQVEYLTFQGSPLASQLGKGHGEGEIVAHALAHSRLLAAHAHFTKVTGKLYLPFFDFLVRDGLDGGECFVPTVIGDRLAIDTRLYSVAKARYLAELLHAHERVNDPRGLFLEHAFHDALQARGYACPLAAPAMLGRSGSLNRSYGDFPPSVHRLYARLIEAVPMGTAAPAGVA
ncbi:MAG: tetratricopeptide repeat protein [Leptothrix sp. (in: b-proteobacteria)]